MILAVALIAWFGGTGAEAMQAAREPMRVDGKCYSACAWAFLANPKSCFTSTAEFKFHGWRDPGTNRLMPKATEYWLTRVPAKLRPVAQRDWTGPTLKRVTSRQMEKLLPERMCK
jgi:hypothetical protein